MDNYIYLMRELYEFMLRVFMFRAYKAANEFMESLERDNLGLNKYIRSQLSPLILPPPQG